MDSVGKLTKEQFWEWKAKILEMQLSQEKLSVQELKVERMFKEAEIQKLHALINKASLDGLKNTVEEAKKDYEETRQRISTEFGFDLKDCIVNPITLEVSKC